MFVIMRKILSRLSCSEGHDSHDGFDLSIYSPVGAEYSFSGFRVEVL